MDPVRSQRSGSNTTKPRQGHVLASPGETIGSCDCLGLDRDGWIGNFRRKRRRSSGRAQINSQSGKGRKDVYCIFPNVQDKEIERHLSLSDDNARARLPG